MANHRDTRLRAYGVAFVIALTAHMAFFLSLKGSLDAGPEFALTTDASVEVFLVAAAPPPGEAVSVPSGSAAEASAPAAEPPADPPVAPAPAVSDRAPSEAPDLDPPKKTPPPRPKFSARSVKTLRASQGSPAIPETGPIKATSSAAGDRAQPSYLRNPHPPYPEEARRAGQQGEVQIRVRVNADGTVASVALVRSSGFPLLDQRALSTVRDGWRFKPARSAGVSIAAEVIVPIRFSLAR